MTAVRVIDKKEVTRRSRSGVVTDGNSKLRVAGYARVSTLREEQEGSYYSQILHYTQMINENQDWELVEVYSDKVTGTQTHKRDDFNRLIDDAKSGKIDLIITKSISRFARNTLDTIKYVRALRDLNVAIKFEVENINTLEMNGELLLVILSSIAQQDVETISGYVIAGLHSRMERGEIVGFNGCLGYDYDPETKMISVNEKEAEIVRYIFDRYINAQKGARTIARECEANEWVTKKGNPKWGDSAITGILQNEKYYGALEQGKTTTLNPITKRRLSKFGEGKKYYIEKHHTPIIDMYTFAKAEDIRRSRSRNSGKGIRNQQCSHKYTFSSMIECGFCGGGVSRRSHSGGTKNKKVVWHCTSAAKVGKKECPPCKSIREEVIEEAFVQSFNVMCKDKKELFSGFIDEIKVTLEEKNSKKDLKDTEKQLNSVKMKIDRILDLHLEGMISESDYKHKYTKLVDDREQLVKKINELRLSNQDVQELENRLAEMTKVLDSSEPLKQFDEVVFKEVVDNVIIGDKDENDPYLIKFIYKNSFIDNGFSVGRSGKNLRKITTSDGKSINSSLYSTDTCGSRCEAGKEVEASK